MSYLKFISYLKSISSNKEVEKYIPIRSLRISHKNKMHAYYRLIFFVGICYSLICSSFKSLVIPRKVGALRCKGTLTMKKLSQVEDDGYSLSNPTVSEKGFRAFLRKTWFGKLYSRFKQPTKPGTLILIRHGESEWNYLKLFTGWVDVDLSERGRREIEHAARLLLEQGYTVDVAYTSRLKRAIRSAWIVLRELNQIYRPVYKSYRLNERMYGALEGLSKPELAAKLSKETIQSYRTGLVARPPAMEPTHPYWHANETKYADLAPDEIPVTESLQDTMERTLPLWQTRIISDLKNGRNVMIVAHGNSLRGIVKHIDGLTADEISKVGIPNGIPLVYKFDSKMQPIRQPLAVSPISGEFLEKKGLLRAALDREAELAKEVPGYEVPDITSHDDKLFKVDPPGADAVVSGLTKLKQEKRLLEHVENIMLDPSVLFRKPTAQVVPDDDSLPGHKDDVTVQALQLIKKRIIDEATERISPDDPKSAIPTKNPPQPITRPENFPKGPLLIIIRHGKTEHNKLGLFTGWEDASLATEGRAEARAAGALMQKHGIELDVVYTSWLSRAIETAWLVLGQLDSLWLPMHKTWRLNERMYGSLTGLSKKMIGQLHGDEQLKTWRRSYAVRPPKISSFSEFYPGNDERYVKYVTKDIPISIFESLIRSLAHGRFEVHRDFPKTESLRDCMERTIPYYKEIIYPQSIEKGKNVLIASSENAIRGLLMHLCEIPTDLIHKVEIPTGLPLVFDFEKKCIKLLDDGRGDPDGDPLAKYDFGTSPEILFRPCDSDNSDSCFITSDGKSYSYDPLIRLVSRENNSNTLDYGTASPSSSIASKPAGSVDKTDKDHIGAEEPTRISSSSTIDTTNAGDIGVVVATSADFAAAVYQKVVPGVTTQPLIKGALGLSERDGVPVVDIPIDADSYKRKQEGAVDKVELLKAKQAISAAYLAQYIEDLET